MFTWDLGLIMSSCKPVLEEELYPSLHSPLRLPMTYHAPPTLRAWTNQDSPFSLSPRWYDRISAHPIRVSGSICTIARQKCIGNNNSRLIPSQYSNITFYITSSARVLNKIIKKNNYPAPPSVEVVVNVYIRREQVIA